MRREISLRFRITLITSLLLILMSLAFTFLGIHNLNINVIEPLEFLIIVDNNQIDVDSGPIDFIDLKTKSIIFSKFSFLFMIVLIFLGTIAMYILSGIALRPAKKLANEINSIDKDSLSKRIEHFNAGDELDSIADSFNLMLGRLESAFEREQRFSSAAAHELKTPLTIVKTNLEVFKLNSNYGENDLTELLSVINSQIDRMISLVEDLMIISSNKVFDKNDIIYLNKLVNEIFLELDAYIIEKKITFNLNLMDSTIIGNNVMIKHAISNLVLNAIKYVENEGEIEVSISELDNQYYLSIKDNGIGIDRSELEYIFEPFYRVEKSRSRKLGGSGLGLPIVKDILLNHNGNIIYEENLPKGSNFIIVLEKAFID